MIAAKPWWRTWRVWTSTAQIVAAVAAVAALVLSIFALRQSNEVSRGALEESQRQAFQITGGQLCMAYRDQVWSMVRAGMSEQQIAAVFRLEPGNMNRPGDQNFRADKGYANGCGAIHDLAVLLPVHQ
jgi:hypothetical protein